MDNTKRAWEIAQRVFPNLNSSACEDCEAQFTKKEFSEFCHYIKSQQLQAVVQQLVFNQIEKKFRDEIVPEFWSCFTVNENGFKQFYSATKSLYNNYKDVEIIVAKLELFRESTELKDLPYNEASILDDVKLSLRSILLSQLYVDYQAVTMVFYEMALKIQETNDNNSCAVCDLESCNCLHLFQETNRKLGDMNILEPLVGQTLTNLSYNYINSHVETVCKDNYNSSIAPLREWLHKVVLNWLKTIYSHDPSVSLNESMITFEKKLEVYLCNSYLKTRIDQLFNIIIEYPESLPALSDIRTCLPMTDLKPSLIRNLQKAMETRLLHPGVSTTDILTAYVSTVNSLKVLDPSGLLLETVTYPIHQYLRSREDTVRCVMSSLTEEGPNDLAEELNKGHPVDENTPMDDVDDDWRNWKPDPVDADINKKCLNNEKPRRNIDIISMLVNIYGSKELFVNEYRTLLADRLLSHFTCDTEKEIRYLELLKLRFGDSHLHFCEVMLKDVADSKRLNQRINEDVEYHVENELALSAMIVSQQFWPAFKDEKLELHPAIEEQMKKFTNSFETLKGSRTLCWKNHLGVVSVQVELDDRLLNLSVSPVHATIIMHFQDNNTWELEALSKVMQCPSTVLRRKMGFWLSHGVVTETKPDVFTVQTANKPTTTEFYAEEFESESAMASVQDQKEEELQNIWSYIYGMLMNLDSLSLDRIHHMLKMFAFQSPTTECSQSELKSFLDRKVKEKQLIYMNGVYKLPK